MDAATDDDDDYSNGNGDRDGGGGGGDKDNGGNTKAQQIITILAKIRVILKCKKNPPAHAQ